MAICPRCGDEFDRPRCDLCVNCTRAVRRLERRVIGGGSTGEPKRLDGFVLGRLTVLGPAIQQGNRGGLMFWCECKCGRERLAKGSELNGGKLRSCGQCRVADFAGPKFVVAEERCCETCSLPFWSTRKLKHCGRRCMLKSKKRSRRKRLSGGYVRGVIAESSGVSATTVPVYAEQIYRSHLRLYRQGKSARLARRK
jgi:hypothetical protein